MKKGYTLIEMVVVVGILGIIMAVVAGILINSFRAKSRVDLADSAEAVGSRVIDQIKNNMIMAVGQGITCALTGDGSRITFASSEDGQVTTLACYEGSRIASESASGIFVLTGSGVGVSGCYDFARCELFPNSTDKVSAVNFSFTLSTGSSAAGAEKFVNRKFQSTVVTRN